jgi:hypothetical protein
MTATPGFDGTQAPAAQPPAGAGYAAPATAPKVSVGWTGILMALGALVAVVGTFLPYEKLVAFLNGSVYGTASFTGLGAQSDTGKPLASFTAGSAGKIVLALGVLLLVMAALILAKKGRLWVSIVSLVMAAFALIMALASLGAPKSDAKDLDAKAAAAFSVHGLTKMGVGITVAGAGVAVLGAILALCLRRRSTV